MSEQLENFQHLLNKRVCYTETMPDGCAYPTIGQLTKLYEISSEYAHIPFATIIAEKSGTQIEINLSHMNSIGLMPEQNI